MNPKYQDFYQNLIYDNKNTCSTNDNNALSV